MANQKTTSRKEYDDELLKVFKVLYNEYLIDNQGYLNILDYLQGRFDFVPAKWKKIARRAGLVLIEREGVYFIKA